MPAVGAGIAQQSAVCVPRQQQRGHLQGVVHPVLVFFQRGRRDLKRCGVVQHIPVVQFQNVLCIGAGRHREAGEVLLLPPGAKGFLFRFRQLFQGRFPAQRRRPVRAPFQIGEPLRPHGPCGLGPPAGLVGVQAGTGVIRPARIELTARAPHHIHVGPLFGLLFGSCAHVTVSRCFSAPDGRLQEPFPYPWL